MTCIIGLVDSGTGKVYMGADSAVVFGWEVRTLKTQKVFRVGEMLIGVTGDIRLSQALQYKVKCDPQPADDRDDLAYLIRVFVEAVRKALKDEGITKIENGIEQVTAGNFIIGYRGALYGCDSNLAITQITDGFDAAGGGREYALGAMAVLDRHSAADRIIRSLKAVEKFYAGVKPPYYVLELSADTHAEPHS